MRLMDLEYQFPIDDGGDDSISHGGLPQQPDWLTAEGGEVWLDDIGRVRAHHLVSEKDTTVFAQYCNLMGACIKAWRSGNVPPVTAIAEARKMQELFGICGGRSRARMTQP